MYKIINGNKEVKVGDKVRLLDEVYDQLPPHISWMYGIIGTVTRVDACMIRVAFSRLEQHNDCWWDIKYFGFEVDHA